VEEINSHHLIQSLRHATDPPARYPPKRLPIKSFPKPYHTSHTPHAHRPTLPPVAAVQESATLARVATAYERDLKKVQDALTSVLESGAVVCATPLPGLVSAAACRRGPAFKALGIICRSWSHQPGVAGVGCTTGANQCKAQQVGQCNRPSYCPLRITPPYVLQYNDTAGVAASAVVATTEPVGGPNFTLQAGTSVRGGKGPLKGSGRLLHFRYMKDCLSCACVNIFRHFSWSLQAKGDLSGKLAGETIKPISDWVAR